MPQGGHRSHHRTPPKRCGIGSTTIRSLEPSSYAISSTCGPLSLPEGVARTGLLALLRDSRECTLPKGPPAARVVHLLIHANGTVRLKLRQLKSGNANRVF